MTDIETNSLKYIIIGMGINFSIPQEKTTLMSCRKKATSLFSEWSSNHNKKINLIINIWNRFFNLLADQNDLPGCFIERKSFVLGKKNHFLKRKDQSYMGDCHRDH